MDTSSGIGIGLVVALGAGISIGLQRVFTGFLGQLVPPSYAGLSIHLAGAVVGLALVLATLSTQSGVAITPRVVLLSFLAGAAGMLIIMGVAFAFPRVGQVIGQTALIMGQMVIAVVVDTFGLAGGSPLPLDGRRILGIVVLAVGIYLLLPRQTA